MYLGGSSENSVEFWKLKNKYKFILIEDACHAFGSSYIFNKKKHRIGSCAHSDMSIFSFHPAKTITTGEGGILTTNNFKFFKKAKIARSHGILRNNKKNHWTYSINNFGMNYRLSDINCALGVSQMKKVRKILKKRHAISKKYNTYLEKFSEFVSVPECKFSNLSSNHLKILIFNLKKLNCKKKDIFVFFKKRNIFLQYHYIPLYKFKIFKLQNNINYPKAENFYKKAISFPIYYSLKEREITSIQVVLVVVVESLVRSKTKVWIRVKLKS
jgi:dTDP-4-amino-4,6-dideoxygalactose transaminase